VIDRKRAKITQATRSPWRKSSIELRMTRGGMPYALLNARSRQQANAYAVAMTLRRMRDRRQARRRDAAAALRAHDNK